jgi:hypothetical protein
MSGAVLRKQLAKYVSANINFKLKVAYFAFRNKQLTIIISGMGDLPV